MPSPGAQQAPLRLQLGLSVSSAVSLPWAVGTDRRAAIVETACRGEQGPSHSPERDTRSCRHPAALGCGALKGAGAPWWFSPRTAAHTEIRWKPCFWGVRGAMGPVLRFLPSASLSSGCHLAAFAEGVARGHSDRGVQPAAVDCLCPKFTGWNPTPVHGVGRRCFGGSSGRGDGSGSSVKVPQRPSPAPPEDSLRTRTSPHRRGPAAAPQAPAAAGEPTPGVTAAARTETPVRGSPRGASCGGRGALKAAQLASPDEYLSTRTALAVY